MEINPSIFRGYDIRGLVGKDLNPEVAEQIGKAYGTFLLKRGINSAVVGHDCRETSEPYSEAITKGILSTGVYVIDIGLALAGNIYWAQHYFKAGGCVSISASHNPAEYNGFKLGTGLSSTMVSQDIEELRQILDKEEFSQGKGNLEKKEIKEEYFNDLMGRFPHPFKFKAVIDPSHSTPAAFVPELLKRVGCEVVCTHCEIDGTFPIGTPDPTSNEVAQRLSRKVMEERADLGLSYDSDGDRIGVVDDKGNILWNDILVAIFASDVLEKNKGAKIVFNTLCSKVVEDVIQQNKGIDIMWRTGHSFIKAKAQEEKALFAGELSGHFYFLDKFYPHDDGCYSTLRLLNYLSGRKKSLSEVVSGLPKYISSPEIKIYCADDKKVSLMEKISLILKKDFPQSQVIDDDRAGDGVRLNMEEGMFVIRYSQNGPYLTVKFEAKVKEDYNRLKNYIQKLLKSYPEIDWGSKINVNTEALVK
ncbi:MAG: phosphomannomutase/phosphoglucomutase [Candidatus Pacebacteria bacterium]|nr:phosphomannomutase/phosphoglucomutase [Candidatus Paceibacterota bacterium]